MDKETQREIKSALGLMSQLGITMVVTIAVGLFFGRFLDGKLGTSPAFLIAGCFLGGAAAIRNLYTMVKKRWDTHDQSDDA